MSKKSGRKLVMLCRKAKKKRREKGDSKQFFRHPLKISLPPPARNPETAPVVNLYQNKNMFC